MTATWNILIATLGQRGDRLRQLLDSLLPQVERYDGQVTVTALWNNGERPLGEVRHELLASATSTYVSFVDDDDELPDYFVDEVMTRLDGEIDYVGWRVQCFIDGRRMKPTYHSLRYSGWSDDRRGYYRDVSHINPIKTTLAQRGDFRRGGPPEDVSWVDQVRPHVVTETYVDKVMYLYRSSTTDTTWQPRSKIRRRHNERHRVDHPYFAYHPGSSQE